MRRLRNSGTANSTTPPRNSTAWVPQRVSSTSVYSSWSIHRYLVHTSDAMAGRTISSTMAPAVIASGELRRRRLVVASGAGRARRRGRSPAGAEHLADNLGASVSEPTIPPAAAQAVVRGLRVQCGAAASPRRSHHSVRRTCKGPLDPMTTASPDPLDAPTAALAAAVLEVARHADARPLPAPRLFALARSAELMAASPSLAALLGAAGDGT